MLPEFPPNIPFERIPADLRAVLRETLAQGLGQISYTSRRGGIGFGFIEGRLESGRDQSGLYVEENPELQSSPNALAELQRLTEVDDETRAQIEQRLHDKSEKMCALYPEDANRQQQIREVRDGLRWRYSGKVGEPVPKYFVPVMGDDGPEHLLPSPKIDPAIATELGSSLNPTLEYVQHNVSRKSSQISKALHHSIEQSPVFQLIQAFQQPPKTNERPLSFIERASREASIGESVCKEFVIRPEHLHGNQAARRHYIQEVAKLDALSVPGKPSQESRDPTRRAKEYFRRRILKEFNDLDICPVDSASTLTSQFTKVLTHEGTNVSEGAHRTVAEINNTLYDNPATAFSINAIRRLYSSTSPTLSHILQWSSHISNTYYPKLEFSLSSFPNEVTGGEVSMLAWIRQAPVLATEFWTSYGYADKLNHAKNMRSEGGGGLVNSEKYERLKNTQVGEVLIDNRTKAERSIRAPRLIMAGKAERELPEVLEEGAVPALRLRFDGKRYQNAFGPSAAHIPGFVAAAQRNCDDHVEIDYIRDGRGDPYIDCDMELSRSDSLLADIWCQFQGLNVISQAIKDQPPATIGDVVHVIADNSVYYLPDKTQVLPTWADPYNIREGRAYLQCTTAANLCTAILQPLYGKGNFRTIGGLTLDGSTITALGHSQVLFVNEGRSVILDATPSLPNSTESSRHYDDAPTSEQQSNDQVSADEETPVSVSTISPSPQAPESRDPHEHLHNRITAAKASLLNVKSSFESQLRIGFGLEGNPQYAKSDALWRYVVANHKKPGNPIGLVARHVMSAARELDDLGRPLPELDLDELERRIGSLEDTAKYVSKLKDPVNFRKIPGAKGTDDMLDGLLSATSAMKAAYQSMLTAQKSLASSALHIDSAE